MILQCNPGRKHELFTKEIYICALHSAHMLLAKKEKKIFKKNAVSIGLTQ